MATLRPAVFNGPVEAGLRALVLLFEVHPAGFDLQQLVTLDYLLVHSADVPGGPPSLHPPSPLRGGEVAIRRGLIEDGLQLYRERGLLHQHPGKAGFEFIADDSAASFLDSFSGEYVSSLRNRATWVVRSFGHAAHADLAKVLNASVGRWATEFVVFAEEDLDEP